MERISALMDGELDGDETARLIPGVKQRDDLREAWETYHLIGEALRGQASGAPGIARAVAAKLAAEPTVLAPRRTAIGPFRRFALPSLAAAAAVASVTWISLETQQGSSVPVAALPANHLVLPAVMTSPVNALPEFAQAPSAPAPQQSPVVMQFPTRHIEAYLAAHQEFSPSTTMQGLAPYARAVAASAVDTGR